MEYENDCYNFMVSAKYVACMAGASTVGHAESVVQCNRDRCFFCCKINLTTLSSTVICRQKLCGLSSSQVQKDKLVAVTATTKEVETGPEKDLETIIHPLFVS
jgi:hypothetical protein